MTLARCLPASKLNLRVILAWWTSLQTLQVRENHCCRSGAEDALRALKHCLVIKALMRLRQHMWMPWQIAQRTYDRRSRRLEAHVGYRAPFDSVVEEVKAIWRWPRNPGGC